jgi:hypothetical protein
VSRAGGRVGGQDPVELAARGDAELGEYLLAPSASVLLQDSAVPRLSRILLD